MKKEDLLQLAEKCLASWAEHWERFYSTPLPGDKETKSGVIMGVQSMRDQIFRALEEEELREKLARD